MASHSKREKLIWESALSATEKIILLCVNSYFNGEVPKTHEGQVLLAQMCGIKTRSVLVENIGSLILSDALIVSEGAFRIGFVSLGFPLGRTPKELAETPEGWLGGAQ